MSLDAINNIVGITVGTITILGLLISYLKKSSIKAFLRNWVLTPNDPEKPVSEDLSYIDIRNGCEILCDAVKSIGQDCYIVAVDRGGAIIGGILAKMHFEPRNLDRRHRIRHMHIDEEGEIHCDFDVTELNNSHVILVDDCTRKGGTIKKANNRLQEECEKKNVKAEITPVVLLRVKSKKDERAGSGGDDFMKKMISAYHTKNLDVKLPWDVTW